MVKMLSLVAGILLGLGFANAAVMVLFGLVDAPPPPEGTPIAHLFAAFEPTGYLTMVKVLELVGGVLVAIPRTRCLGLLVLGPILVNILAFHWFVAGDGFGGPMVLGLCALALFLLWAERRAFAGLIASAR
jgi:putative oxidoreductase